MKLIAKSPVYINGAWIHEGQEVPSDVAGYDYEHHAAQGRIEEVNGRDITNIPLPEADAGAAGESGGGPALQEAFNTQKAEAERWQTVANENGAKVTNLTQEVTRLQGELTKAQASAASPEDQAALAEYREVVGTLLAHDFPSRKILLENGYYTPETVQAASDDELNGLKGISDAKLADIRKVAPYSSGE